jgi:hypothetical protein
VLAAAVTAVLTVVWSVPAVAYRSTWTLVAGIAAGRFLRGRRLAVAASAALLAGGVSWLATSPLPFRVVALSTARLALIAVAAALVVRALYALGCRARVG